MAFKYNSADASSAWPEGDYSGHIASIEEGKSKTSGKDMLTLGIKVYNKEGKEKLVTDYIVNPSGLFKLEQIARAFGKGAEFKANTFDVFTVKDKRLTITLKVTPPNGDFGEKNDVKKYATAVAGGKPTTRPPAAESNPSMAQVLREREAVGASSGSPISGEQQFKEDDIPF